MVFTYKSSNADLLQGNFRCLQTECSPRSGVLPNDVHLVPGYDDLTWIVLGISIRKLPLAASQGLGIGLGTLGKTHRDLD
jgi:hypothetical protein